MASSGLAPIIETDDIAVDGRELQQSSSAHVASDGGAARQSAAEVAAVPTAPRPAPVRRPSLLVATVETTRRALEQHAHRMSWAGFRDSLSTVGIMHAETSPDVIRAMKPRARLDFYLTQAEESQTGWVLHHIMLFILVINVAVMAAETLDGPRFGSTQPAYAYLPGDAFFLAAENGFTAIYLIDFVVRAATASSQKAFWKSKYTWIMVVAWLPDPIYQGLHTMSSDDPSFDSIKVRGLINYLRLARLLRIIAMTRVHIGSKVMFKATRESIAPLKITLFFLITVVMVFATAIFYAEPCYDLKTCTFTDIFNAGYFVMVTVATVGYGSQVPSLYNGASVVLTVIIMIFGSLYLAMPLAIVGIRYDAAWREYEHEKASKSSHFLAPNALVQAAAAGSSVGAHDEHKPLRVQQNLVGAKDLVDETLEPLESGKVYTVSYQISDRFYDLSQKIGDVTASVRSMLKESSRKSVAKMSPPSPSTSAAAASGDVFVSDDKASIAQIQRVKARNEASVKVLDTIMEVLKLHKKISSEIRALLPVAEHTKSAHNLRVSSGSRSMTKRNDSFGKATTGVLSRARLALSSVTGSRRGDFLHVGPPTWRSRTWDLLEHRDVAQRARIINRIRLYLVVLSIVLFYAQTTPELQATGVKTPLCRRSLSDFCHSSSPGFGDQPGCFVLDSSGKPTSTPLNFMCNDDSDDPTCEGNAYNFGSDRFSSTCEQVFGHKGVQRICNNRLCKPPITLWVDMEKKWIGFEFFFGILFTFEMLLRLIVHPQPKRVCRDFVFIIDLIALFPFYVEVAEIIGGIMPVYSVVPTAPSFYAVIRVFKTFRVLKLGPHISGSEVLARTALLVYKRLMIPVFFLFIGSVISGAIFYELERGTECFVGKECLWWGKELLTPAIVGSYPDGKRLLVQNNHPTLITDMLRSTWFSIVTMTTVGYGDMRPRTALGRFFDILLLVLSACYTAMPLTLVGGQFYVCYEVHLRDKRRAQTAVVEPKPCAAKAVSNETAHAERPKDTELREPALMSLAGLTDDPVIPGLNAPISSSPSSPAPAVPTTVGHQGVLAQTEQPRPTISLAELQLLNHFVLITKVLDEVVEDLSQLNKLGSQRVALKKDRLDDEVAALVAAEAKVETKIDNNLTFCATVLLNFAPVIEKILGLQDSRASHSNLAMPSILHSSAMEVGADAPTALPKTIEPLAPPSDSK